MSAALQISQPATVEHRAKLSCGTSADPIYRMVLDTIQDLKNTNGGVLLDVGCGQGQLWNYVSERFDRYVGADVVKYDHFPKEAEFCKVDLDSGRVDFPEHSADIVVAVETIEHLENPWAFVRELSRLVKIDGWVIVTTPNQLSLLSKLGLLFKNEFPHFRTNNLPHITALLERDLRRMSSDCRWRDIQIRYTKSGRLPGTARSWPKFMSKMFPRAFSDNVLIAGRPEDFVEGRSA